MPTVDKASDRLLRRFLDWASTHEPPTRWLDAEISDRLVTDLMIEGFKARSKNIDDPQTITPPYVLLLALEQLGAVSYIEIRFGKWGSPRFQVEIGVWDKTLGRTVRIANVVARHQEFYHEWGKPWWCPILFWTQSRAVAEVTKVCRAKGQIFQFLRFGARGPNISADFCFVEIDGERVVDLKARKRSLPYQ